MVSAALHPRQLLSCFVIVGYLMTVHSHPCHGNLGKLKIESGVCVEIMVILTIHHSDYGNKKLEVIMAQGIIGKLVRTPGDWVDHTSLVDLRIKLVAQACEQIEGMPNTVGIVICEQVAINVDI